MSRLALPWRLLLPLLFLLSVVAPSLRHLPGGRFLPDLWLLLVLLVTSPPPILAWKPPLFLVALAAFARASVSAVSPAANVFGLAGGLLLRDLAFRRLRDDLLPMRLVTGLLAALPLACSDAWEARHLGADLPLSVLAWRTGGIALCWAILRRPPRLRPWKEGKA